VRGLWNETEESSLAAGLEVLRLMIRKGGGFQFTQKGCPVTFTLDDEWKERDENYKRGKPSGEGLISAQAGSQEKRILWKLLPPPL